jgi:hypothetical protein
MNQPPDKKENAPDLLTRIRDAYTLAYTPECSNEADEVMVRNFLHTLAEVALAVASRKGKDKEGKQ